MIKPRNKPTETELEIKLYVAEYKTASEKKQEFMKCEAWKMRFKWNKIVEEIDKVM